MADDFYHRLAKNRKERETLREKGQFWTPDWVAEAMVAYVVKGGASSIFDPAVGAGAFFRAANRVAVELDCKVTKAGTELDRDVLRQAWESGLSMDDFQCVQIRDFVLDPPESLFNAIVANPPYIRHHRLSSHVKERLRLFSTSLLGRPIDGRAGLHIYFLLRALELLEKGGRLAFIMPADTCEGVFARSLWDWISSRFCLDAVITFSPEGTPFPGVDTNPIVFLIRNVNPSTEILWAVCRKSESADLKNWIMSGFIEHYKGSLEIYRRTISEALATGLSRKPATMDDEVTILRDFARVMRGIATGANQFFLMDQQKAVDFGIPGEFLIPAISRTRDVRGNQITLEDLQEIEARGRPTLLLSLDGRPKNKFPKSVREYIDKGEALKIHERTLVKTRRPWYRMEVRTVPPILFAYLGRRNARFIRNYAGVVPLTGFLCVYPYRTDHTSVENLWTVLQHPETLRNLKLVGKSYGGGAIKVEPRALEQLPLPRGIISALGLEKVSLHQQIKLFS